MFAVPVQLVGALLLATCGGSSGGVEQVSTVVPPVTPPPIPLEVEITDLRVDPGPTAGSVVLTFTAPGDAGESAADAYVVRASRQQITADTLPTTTLVPNQHTPGAPGTTETFAVTGLEPGRTMQLCVLAVHDGKAGDLGTAAGGRVAGRDVPPTPGNATSLSGPATLSQTGATYVLTQDVTTSGTAFTITAPGITLDLGGHRVVYGTGTGTHHGVTMQHVRGAGLTTVRNGTLVQGGGSGDSCHGLFLWDVDDLRVTYLDVTVSGRDAMGMYLTDPGVDVRVDHCTVACGTTVVSNRHYPGVSAIFVEGASGAVEIDQNLVTGSPQWGIRVDAPATSGTSLVHHNRIQGTKALVANGYMLGMAKPGLDVFENVLEGESRGIHLNGIDGASRNVWVHDNHIETQDQPNPEYPDGHWTHGIKIEGAPGVLVERNDVTGRADPTHAEVRGLDVHVGDAQGIVVRGNRVEAVSFTSSLEATAVYWTYGSSSPPNDVTVRHNVFTATDHLVLRFWDGGIGGLFRDNWWIRDVTQGSAHAFDFEFFGNADTVQSNGHRFLDPYPSTHVLDVVQWDGPAPYESTREWSLTVKVTAGAGPLAGATVTVKDAGGATMWTHATNADGWAAGNVLGTRVTRGPSFVSPGPYGVSVAAPGRTTWTGSHTVSGTTAFRVDLASGQGSLDTTPPDAPAGLRAHPLSASRLVATWDAPDDDTRVKEYLVRLDGKPWAITDQPAVFLGGLDAATRYVLTVQALDAGGNVSDPTQGVAVTTRPEDRGP